MFLSLSDILAAFAEKNSHRFELCHFLSQQNPPQKKTDKIVKCEKCFIWNSVSSIELSKSGYVQQEYKKKFGTDERLNIVINYQFRESRDLLKQADVWMQKDRIISIAKILVNAASKWREWSKDYSFGLSLSDMQQPPETSTQKIAEPATRKTLEHSLGRA